MAYMYNMDKHLSMCPGTYTYSEHVHAHVNIGNYKPEVSCLFYASQAKAMSTYYMYIKPSFDYNCTMYKIIPPVSLCWCEWPPWSWFLPVPHWSCWTWAQPERLPDQWCCPWTAASVSGRQLLQDGQTGGPAGAHDADAGETTAESGSPGYGERERERERERESMCAGTCVSGMQVCMYTGVMIFKIKLLHLHTSVAIWACMHVCACKKACERVQILTMFRKLVNLFSLNILNTRVEI